MNIDNPKEGVENKKAQKAWAFYDWANSVYSLVISTAIFPIYYNAVTSDGEFDQIVFLGMEWTNTSLYSYALSFSFLVITLISPLLSGIADYANRKKTFLRRFCYLGAISCGTLFFFDGISTLWIGLLATILASIGFWGSQVFYNAYLPELAPKEEQDSLSAKGYAYGYIGGSLLLMICLVLIQGGFLESGIAIRISFLIVGLWWAGFAQITFKQLPEPKDRKSIKWRNVWNGYEELIKFSKQLMKMSQLQRYLLSFFFFSMGVQTVILLASLFGDKELGLPTASLIGTILIIQFVGIAGAYLFAWISRRIGNLNGLKIAILIWMLICVGAYLMDKNDPNVEYQFYVMGGLVGLVMGGIQSLARSTYSKMLPIKGEHTTFFSFYDVTEKLAIVIGTFAYGFIEEITGSMHNSALSLGVFFLFSLISIQFVKPVSRT